MSIGYFILTRHLSLFAALTTATGEVLGKTAPRHPSLAGAHQRRVHQLHDRLLAEGIRDDLGAAVLLAETRREAVAKTQWLTPRDRLAAFVECRSQG